MMPFRANMAHLRQSRPGFGVGFQVAALQTFCVVPFSWLGGRIGPTSQKHWVGLVSIPVSYERGAPVERGYMEISGIKTQSL